MQVVKINGYEADDVVATLTDQVLQRGFRVVIGSPDKDFKQLISEDVQIVMPMPEFGRWSFYTLKHYVAQYNCEPSSDLSLREYSSLVLFTCGQFLLLYIGVFYGCCCQSQLNVE